jgi:excisionase family DNA binding protein
MIRFNQNGRGQSDESPRPAPPKSILERLDLQLREIVTRQERVERLVSELHASVAAPALTKAYYTTAEAAELLHRKPFTVRQWARLGRIHAEKTHSGRGIDPEWRISKEEIVRIQNEGLLPIPARY